MGKLAKLLRLLEDYIERVSPPVDWIVEHPGGLTRDGTAVCSRTNASLLHRICTAKGTA